MRLIVAIDTREVKTSLFLALSAVDNAVIVATASSTSELVSYCRALRPDVVVMEDGLPGRPLTDVLNQLSESMSTGRILVIDGDQGIESKYPNVQRFTDIDPLIEAVP